MTVHRVCLVGQITWPRQPKHLFLQKTIQIPTPLKHKTTTPPPKKKPGLQNIG